MAKKEWITVWNPDPTSIEKARKNLFVTEDDIILWNTMVEDLIDNTEEPPTAQINRITELLEASVKLKKKLRKVV